MSTGHGAVRTVRSATLPKATIPQDNQQEIAPATVNDIAVAEIFSNEDFSFLRDMSENDDDLFADADDTLLPFVNAHQLAFVDEVTFHRLD